MMKLLDATHTLFPPAQAETIAAAMQADDGWTYRVKHDPNGTGYSFIEVYDEDGDFVARV
jgi:hypothetical protein